MFAVLRLAAVSPYSYSFQSDSGNAPTSHWHRPSGNYPVLTRALPMPYNAVWQQWQLLKLQLFKVPGF